MDGGAVPFLFLLSCCDDGRGRLDLPWPELPDIDDDEADEGFDKIFLRFICNEDDRLGGKTGFDDHAAFDDAAAADDDVTGNASIIECMLSL